MRELRVVRPRLGAAVAAMLVLLGATGFLPGSSPDARGAVSRLTLQGRAVLAPGVDHLRYSTSTPLNAIHVVRVKAGARISVRPMLSKERVIGDSTSSGLETTSSMCKRARALACINGDFTACYGCTAPLGGLIRNAEFIRSPNGSPQLWVSSGRMGAGELKWLGRLRATYEWTAQVQDPETGEMVTEPRSSLMNLGLSGVNIVRPANGLVLYTPRWSPTGRTGTASGGIEVAVTGDARAAVNRQVNIKIGPIGTGGNAVIPTNGFVLSANGAAEALLREYWLQARRHPDRLTSATVGLLTTPTVQQSLGGHPVILHNGQPLPPPAPGDTASLARHPRTVVGWNAAGDRWLVTIDGRRSGYSVGMNYWEAANVLRQLGATEGINLDGGGSTTFVAKRCSGSLCVRNWPSDGRERAVTTALAVIPLG